MIFSRDVTHCIIGSTRGLSLLQRVGMTQAAEMQVCQLGHHCFSLETGILKCQTHYNMLFHTFCCISLQTVSTRWTSRGTSSRWCSAPSSIPAKQCASQTCPKPLPSVALEVGVMYRCPFLKDHQCNRGTSNNQVKQVALMDRIATTSPSMPHKGSWSKRHNRHIV